MSCSGEALLRATVETTFEVALKNASPLHAGSPNNCYYTLVPTLSRRNCYAITPLHVLIVQMNLLADSTTLYRMRETLLLYCDCGNGTLNKFRHKGGGYSPQRAIALRVMAE